MVFTTPNQLSLVLQQVRFLALFGHLLSPKMLAFDTLGAQREAKAAQEAPKKRTLEKDSKKELKKTCLSKGTGSAFYFGALADQLACIVEKPEERIQDFLSSSPTPSSRAIVYCTILCSAVLY